MNKEERTKTLINNIKLNTNEQNVYEFGLCVEQWKQILDYIEQLQQENKKYKEINEFLKSEIEEAKRIFQKYLEYIDERDEKINKSIEYVENNSLYEEEYDYDYEENSYLSGINDEIAKKDLLKILKGVE